MTTTVAELIRARADDDHVALCNVDQSWTYREYVALCAQRAAFLLAHRRPGPFHVGILLENVPEFPFWFGACAMAGAAMVGLNSTRRGADLARDIRHTDCQLIVTGNPHQALLADCDTGLPSERIIDVDAAGYGALLAPYAHAPLPDVHVSPQDIFSLIFTSGSTGAPKACICSHGRIAELAKVVAGYFGYDRDSVSYVPMPWFHNSAISMGWLPAVAGGGTVVIRKFTVSGFMDDVRRHRVTHFNYVGKALAYLLTAPERPDDGQNTLKLVHGNEGAVDDRERFARRFNCPVLDGYGSTEGGISIGPRPGMPRGCLGVANQEGVRVMNPDTRQECAPARFDAQGRLLNANEAIGEIVNIHGAEGFEGYWKNEEAAHRRVRDGIYWSGDLAYRDEAGYFWFAGRDDDWMRVDGENIAAAQVEQVLVRHPDVVLAGVYAVPDCEVGDRVMAALQLRPGAVFDPAVFESFLAEQSDLGTKWTPSFVRLTGQMPVTATSKILRGPLRRERWRTADPVWWKPARGQPYRRLTAADIAAYEGKFAPGVLERLK